MIFPLSERSNMTRLSRYHSSPSTLAVELYHKGAIAGEAEAPGKRFTQTQRSFWTMAHLLFFRTCRHSGVTVGTLDLDRALERTSIMQRVTYEKT